MTKKILMAAVLVMAVMIGAFQSCVIQFVTLNLISVKSELAASEKECLLHKIFKREFYPLFFFDNFQFNVTRL